MASSVMRSWDLVELLQENATNDGILKILAIGDAFTVDGKLDEKVWRLTSKLSNGQAFDILWDGEKLYVGAEAKNGDTTLVVKQGDTTLATATLAEGATAFEFDIAYPATAGQTIENLSVTIGDSFWSGNVTFLKNTRQEEIDLSKTFNILEKKNSGYYSRLVDTTVDLGVALAAGEYNVTCVYNEHCTSFKQKQSGVYYYTAICVDPLEYTAEGKVTAEAIAVPEPEETPAE